jgi:PIN domain nuclease of toxin-antitoxin system
VSFLLDTHIALWAITNNPRLPSSIRTYIENPEIRIAVSVASVWEISIKHALGRRRPDAMPISADAALTAFVDTDLEILTISGAHAIKAGTLPLLHADPFDRMLVAQAMTESLVLITHNKTLAAYHAGVIVV